MPLAETPREAACVFAQCHGHSISTFSKTAVAVVLSSHIDYGLRILPILLPYYGSDIVDQLLL